jgi:hypothetical protein
VAGRLDASDPASAGFWLFIASNVLWGIRGVHVAEERLVPK